MRLNPSKMAALHRELTFPNSPSFSGGYMSTDPRGSDVHADYPQVYTIVRISLISGDPNSNGGRDSNGYYRAYVQDADFNSVTGLLYECRVEPYSGQPNLADGLVTVCFPIGNTSSSPTPSDNGFIIYVPVSATGASVLLGKWKGSQTITGGVPQVGTSAWLQGTTAPVEIFGGPTPGSETDQNYYVVAMNWAHDIIPISYVLLGNNGWGWYLIGTGGPQLAKWTSSGGNPQYWLPGQTQSVIVWGGSPYTETSSGVTISNVANRWGPIAPGFIWIDFDVNTEQWYVIAPQTQAVLCQYTGSGIWQYNSSVGINQLKVWGGIQGAEVDQSWFINRCYNYLGNILPSTTGPVWVWIANNGFNDGNFSNNWYVVQAPTGPLLGQISLSGAGVAGINTQQSIALFDEHWDSTGQNILARLLMDLANDDFVIVFWDWNNFEYYAFAPGRPLIGKPASSIVSPATGSVALYDSHGFSLAATASNVQTPCGSLLAGNFCLVFWDWYQQCWYGVPVAFSPAYGQYTTTQTTLTGSNQIEFTAQDTPVGITLAGTGNIFLQVVEAGTYYVSVSGYFTPTSRTGTLTGANNQLILSDGTIQYEVDFDILPNTTVTIGGTTTPIDANSKWVRNAAVSGLFTLIVNGQVNLILSAGASTTIQGLWVSIFRVG